MSTSLTACNVLTVTTKNKCCLQVKSVSKSPSQRKRKLSETPEVQNQEKISSANGSVKSEKARNFNCNTPRKKYKRNANAVRRNNKKTEAESQKQNKKAPTEDSSCAAVPSVTFSDVAGCQHVITVSCCAV